MRGNQIGCSFFVALADDKVGEEKNVLAAVEEV
jgi:hypothetical protein